MDCVDQDHLIISKASVDDAAAIVCFLNAVGGETDFLTFGVNGFPFSVDEEKEIISTCGGQGQSLMLVGKIGNTIVSQLFLERSSMDRLAHIGTVGMTVSRQYWRQAVGESMMAYALDWAVTDNITKLQLFVRCDNEPAIQLYKKLGFCIEGIISRSVKINDEYFSNYLMGLDC